MVMMFFAWRPMFSSITRHASALLSPNPETFLAWDEGLRLAAKWRSICTLTAMAICVALAASSQACVAQSTMPGSHSADSQSDKPGEGGQAPAVGGVNTGGAHAAVLDQE